MRARHRRSHRHRTQEVHERNARKSYRRSGVSSAGMRRSVLFVAKVESWTTNNGAVIDHFTAISTIYSIISSLSMYSCTRRSSSCSPAHLAWCGSFTPTAQHHSSAATLSILPGVRREATTPRTHTVEVGLKPRHATRSLNPGTAHEFDHVARHPMIASERE